MDNFFGYAVSALIGVSLGLIGGGGSIIAVPMLVYLFHIEPVFATAYSLVIVGSTSLVGSIRSSLNKIVDFKTAILFSIPSLVAVYLTRHFLLPHIPSIIFSGRGIYPYKRYFAYDLLFRSHDHRFFQNDYEQDYRS